MKHVTAIDNPINGEIIEDGIYEYIGIFILAPGMIKHLNDFPGKMDYPPGVWDNDFHGVEDIFYDRYL
jgi:hypothetical protein